MSRDRRRRTPRDRRSVAGFTLIELLVVILILGILVALLVPALAGAVGRARDAQVTAEITNIGQSLSSFHSKFGFYPPSRIIVNESVALDAYPVSLGATIYADTSLTWGDNAKVHASPEDISIGQLAQRTVQTLKRMFPKIYTGIPAAGTTANPLGNFHNFNGSYIIDPGTQKQISTMDTGWYVLEGHECLAFFLGGLPVRPPQNLEQKDLGVSGFSKNPSLPFRLDDLSNPNATPNRFQSFYEFRSERLIDEDGDGVPGYLDPRNPPTDGRFFAYFSAYGSNSYDPNDVNFVPGMRNVSSDEGYGRRSRVTIGIPTGLAWSYAPNPYTASVPIYASGTQPVTYQNKDSYQLISAGVDGIFGPGGQFSADSSGSKLPVDGAITDLGQNAPPASEVGAVRRPEQDNLTNFAQSKLD